MIDAPAKTFEDPFRLRVQKGMSDLFRRINPANGYPAAYNMNSADSVQRGRAGFGVDDPVPMISILEVPIPADQQPSPGGSTANTGWTDYVVQGWVTDDVCHPTDPAHPFMAYVKYVLAQERKRAYEAMRRNERMDLLCQESDANSVLEMDIGTGVVRPPDNTSAKAYFWLVVRVKLSEDLANPYS